MARYLQIAAQANEVVGAILATVPEKDRPQLAASLAKLYNLGIRTSPRPCQSTVRINAVTAALKGHGVRIGSKQVPVSPGNPKTFTALTITANEKVEVEGGSDDAE